MPEDKKESQKSTRRRRRGISAAKRAIAKGFWGTMGDAVLGEESESSEKEPAKRPEKSETTIIPQKTVFSPSPQKKKEVAEQSIYINIVLDSTASMQFIYESILMKLERMLLVLNDKRKKMYKGISLKWGLTLIQEKESKNVEFGKELFSSDTKKVCNVLRKLELKGGAENGRENINDAINLAMKNLMAASEGKSPCGLILLTDSLPEEEQLEPDFSESGILRFAYLFVFDADEYEPEFSVVDEDGEEASDSEELFARKDMQDFLDNDEIFPIETQIRKLMDELKKQSNL